MVFLALSLDGIWRKERTSAEPFKRRLLRLVSKLCVELAAQFVPYLSGPPLVSSCTSRMKSYGKRLASRFVNVQVVHRLFRGAISGSCSRVFVASTAATTILRRDTASAFPWREPARWSLDVILFKVLEQ
jgi:hypothetical protein